MSENASSRGSASNGSSSSSSAATEGGGEIDLDEMIGEEIRFPKEVEEFLMSLYEEIYDRNLENMRKLYETDFNQVTEQYFTDSRWPNVEEVSGFYRQFKRYHSLIVTLYSELYYRHALSKCPNRVSWADRRLAWHNYCLLLNYFIEDECSESRVKKGLQLPSQWLWDILDEFVYQFQEATRWRARQEDTQHQLKDDCEVWKAATVLEFLHLLAESSNVKEFIKRNKEEFSRSNLPEIELKYQLGYFALICLLRTHVLLGNYRVGVHMVRDLELSTRSLYWKAPACHVTIFYNLGFAYLMSRRYMDAMRHMSQLLIFVSKQRSYLSSQSYQQSAMSRMTDRMLLLVAMCSALVNTKLDENIASLVKEKFPDKYYKLQQDDEETYRDMFNKACPKFVNPHVPTSEDDLHDLANAQSEPHQRQLNIFLKEVRYFKKVSNVRSYAKLYNNIQLQKLASLMEVKEKDAEDLVSSDMLCAKHKSRQLIWKAGDLLSGELVPIASDVDFYLDGGILHVKDLLQSIQKGSLLPIGLPPTASSGGGRGRGTGMASSNVTEDRSSTSMSDMFAERMIGFA